MILSQENFLLEEGDINGVRKRVIRYYNLLPPSIVCPL